MTTSPARMISNLGQRLWQVILTYRRRWLFCIDGPLLLIHFLWVICFGNADLEQQLYYRSAWAIVLDIHVCAASFLICIQLRDQVSDTRSWLTPSFLVPHVIVAGFFISLIMTVTAFVHWRILHFSFSGSLAVITLTSSLVAFCSYALVMEFAILLPFGFFQIDKVIEEIAERGLDGLEWFCFASVESGKPLRLG